MEQVVATKQGKFVIRPYRAEDEEGVLSLWQAAFGKSMDYGIWRWKYLRNPYGHQIMLCVSEGDVPVAMYSGIPFRAGWLGEKARFTSLMDNMSHPAYRSVLGGRSGLFIRTAGAFFDHFGGPHASVFMYGYPGERHFRLGEKLLEYGRFSTGVSFLADATDNPAGKCRPFQGRIMRIGQPGGELDKLEEKCRAQYPFACRRDSQFLQWRFLDHPAKSYEIWGYRSFFGRAWRAYAVFAHQQNSTTLVDMLAARPDDGVRDFIGRLGKALAAGGIEKIQTWLPAGHFLTAELIGAGFDPRPEPLGIIPGGRTFHSDLDFEWAAGNFYYTMADGDLF